MTATEIKKMRKEKNLTQKKLGEICGVSHATISLWEYEKREPCKSSKLLLSLVKKGIIK